MCGQAGCCAFIGVRKGMSQCELKVIFCFLLLYCVYGGTICRLGQRESRQLVTGLISALAN